MVADKLYIIQDFTYAIMHRDYQSNMPIRLYQFSNRIEIMNAGGLYGEARPENFPKVNDYRNPVIAEAMKVMKYVNMFNRGIDRVQTMLSNNGNQAADFDISKLTVFSVTVYATDGSDLIKTPKVIRSVTKKLTKSISEQIVDFCREPRSITEIADHVGLQHRTNLKRKYINPLLGVSLQMTIPDKPTSRFQKYVVTN